MPRWPRVATGRYVSHALNRALGEEGVRCVKWAPPFILQITQTAKLGLCPWNPPRRASGQPCAARSGGTSHALARAETCSGRACPPWCGGEIHALCHLAHATAACGLSSAMSPRCGVTASWFRHVAIGHSQPLVQEYLQLIQQYGLPPHTNRQPPASEPHTPRRSTPNDTNSCAG